ncbi:hypothetical protein D9M71_312000 [compost metagenome]
MGGHTLGELCVDLFRHGGGLTPSVEHEGLHPAIGRTVVLGMSNDQWRSMQRRVIAGDGRVQVSFGEVDGAAVAVDVAAGTEERDEFHGLCAGMGVHAHSLPGRLPDGF